MSTRDVSDESAVEYTNAEEYDLENRWGADDDFYLQLAAAIGGPVLDVGCGQADRSRAG